MCWLLVEYINRNKAPIKYFTQVKSKKDEVERLNKELHPDTERLIVSEVEKPEYAANDMVWELK